LKNNRTFLNSIDSDKVFSAKRDLVYGAKKTIGIALMKSEVKRDDSMYR